MQISHVQVQNYRALKDVQASFASFACIIGENNSGKSSLLQAFLSFLDGKSLEPTDYYDETEPVTISVRFEDVTDRDLDVLAEEHRNRIKDIIQSGSLTLVRRFPLGERSQLRCKLLLPKEQRFRETVYDAGLKGKKGKAVRDYIEAEYPELVADGLGGITTQKKAKELIQNYVSGLALENMELDETALPSGIPESVKALFPVPMYVPAVKNLSDEIKTSKSATFGKLLGLLSDAIEPELSDVKGWFDELDQRLNRILGPDKNPVDKRIPEVQRIEAAVEQNLRETFSNVNVELKIPPPELSMILQGADFEIDDGVKGTTDTKGDGLRRAVTFAILRCYSDLLKQSAQVLEERRNEYLFLFEEPELYLHPVAQATLFDALSLMSKRNQVVISTHSPFFFRPDNTDRFIRIRKVTSEPKPIGQLAQIDLQDMSDRDLFQIISFETSNGAFFARKVLLVEGDSELIALPHIARSLNEEWDFAKSHIALVKIGGKGNVQRFRQFFERFGIEVSVVADLDILIDGYEKLGVQQHATTDAVTAYSDGGQASRIYKRFK